MATLGEYKDDRPSLVHQVRIASWSTGADVFLISQLHRFHGVVSRVSVVILGFVVHERDVKVLLAGNSLEEHSTAIEEGTPWTIPIHNKCVDAHVAGILNLLAQDVRILAVIADVDVVRVAEPGLVIRENLGIARRVRDILEREIPRIRVRARARNGAHHHDIRQKRVLIKLHPDLPLCLR